MTTNKKAASTATPLQFGIAKVENRKQIYAVCGYFRYMTGTTLDCAEATGIRRNSITWYVRELEHLGMLETVCIKPDRTTGREAKHYSSAIGRKGGAL
jgi:hypothetical protein